MCYCYRKLVNLTIFNVFLCMRGRIRPLTASHGLGLSLSANQMTGNRVRECMGGRERPWEAEFGLSSPRPHRICHVICLSQSDQPLRSDSQICEADRPLTHSGRCSPISRLNALHRPVCVRGRSASQIGLSNHMTLWWEAVGVQARPHTHTEDRTASPAVRERPIGLTDLRVRSVRPICEAVGVRSASHAHRPRVRSSGLSDWFHG